MYILTCNDVQYVDGGPGKGHAIPPELVTEEGGCMFVFLQRLLVQVSGFEVGLH